MPCCQIPNPAAPVFPPTLIPDAERFSKYAGGATLVDIGTIAPRTVLTSALHLEMKLWDTKKPLPQQYLKNDSEHNSWAAMSNRTTAPRTHFSRFSQDAQRRIYSDVSIKTTSAACHLINFDTWLLTMISNLRQRGLANANILVWAPHGKNKPPELGTYGLAQKLINVFLKHELCWHVAGRWVGYPPFVLYAPPRSPDLPQYLCALHAPIDRLVLKALTARPLGLRRKGKELLKNNGDVKQSSDGNFRPWSKLDCLRTYYGLQLMLRRIAMNTWPVGCACGGASGRTPAAAAKKLTQDCADWFEKTFGPKHPCQNDNIDWIKAACELKDEVIEETLVKIRGNVTDSGSGGSAPAALRTNPSSCENSGKDQPIFPSSGCPQCDLGNAILAEHRSRLGAIPAVLPPLRAGPIKCDGTHRIRCSSASGWAWQYHVNLKTVRVDLFSQGSQAVAVDRYRTFCAARVNPPFPGYPPFPFGIIGNKSRSIRKSTRTGANAGHANFPNIAIEAVDIMQQIFTL